MPIEILMPALSPTMTEGNLVKWHKKEGDPVKAGDVIAEIETDKATMEVEAVDEGRLGKILVPEGTEQVKVNQVIALLLEEGEDVSALKKAVVAPLPSPKKDEATPSSQPIKKPEPTGTPQPSLAAGTRVFATPLARRMAKESQLNIGSIPGSGPRGRILKADIEQALTQQGTRAAPGPLLS